MGTGEQMLPEHIFSLLNSRGEAHTEALQLYEESNFVAADEAFARAAAEAKSVDVPMNVIFGGEENEIKVSIARNAAYGRVLLHWALETQTMYHYETDPETRREKLQLAYARAARGLVCLTQDLIEHRIVTDDEVDAARGTVRFIQNQIDALPDPSTAIRIPKGTPAPTLGDASILLASLTRDREKLVDLPDETEIAVLTGDAQILAA